LLFVTTELGKKKDHSEQSDCESILCASPEKIKQFQLEWAYIFKAVSLKPEVNFKMLLLSGIFQSYYMNYLNLLDKMEESAEGSLALWCFPLKGAVLKHKCRLPADA